MIKNAICRKTLVTAFLVLAALSLYAISFLSLYSISGKDELVNAFSEQEKRTVIIDAGHGGEDSGAVSASNVYEKDLNLEIAFKLGEYLTASGYSVVYT